MDESIVVVPENGPDQSVVVVQPEVVSQEVVVAQKDDLIMDDFDGIEVAEDYAVSQAMDNLEITNTQAVRDAIPKLHEYFAYKLMVSNTKLITYPHYIGCETKAMFTNIF